MEDSSSPESHDSSNEPDEPSARLADDADAILDEIDEVLEENAEEFVRSYRQRGGNGGGFGLELAEELKQRMSDEDAYKLFDLLERVQSLSAALRTELLSERWGSEIAELMSYHLDEEPEGIYHFLQNLPHFDYHWEPGQTTDIDIDSATSAHRLIRQARTSLLNHRVSAARQFLIDAARMDPSISDLISDAYGFVLRPWNGLNDQSALRWITSMWKAFSDRELSEEEQRESRSVQDVAQVQGNSETASDASRPTLRDTTGVSSQYLGSSLEEDILRLFKVLFNIPDETSSLILDRLRRQTAGSQFGRDVEFDCTTTANERVRCHVECKNYTNPISLSEVAVKLAQEELRPAQGRDLDHWILISPRAVVSNELNDAVDHWNESRRYPFMIQLWTPDSDIQEFFSLEPDVYKHYFNSLPGRRSASERNEVLNRWRDKIAPHMRLDPALVQYLKDPRLHCFAGESADEFEMIRKNAVPLYATELIGSRASKLLTDIMNAWLSTEPATRLLLVGDFGDGKTFFTYSFSRWLAEQFLVEPRSGIIPIRIPLRRLRDFQSARELVKTRLDEIGIPFASWERAALDNKTLVFLDGFDELSSTLDDPSISGNVARLMQCCREFPRSFIIITSRAWFFESGRDRELILPRIGSPNVWRIMPVERRDAVRYLETTAINEETLQKVSILRQLNDPLGLASKPLFLEMIRETLPGIPEEGLTEVQLYELYTQNSLLRKLEDMEEGILGYSPEELVDALHHILETVAVRLQESGVPALDLRPLGYEYDFADLLWRMASDELQNSATEDATQRVGVRSLLQRVPSRDREEWLVDFFHRSVHEYYTARGIVSAADRCAPEDIRMLGNISLRPEIKWFACEMIKLSSTSDRLVRIEELVRRSAAAWDGPRLGGNCLTLLAGVLGRLPNAHWSNLSLDYADLTEADLTGVNFRNTSLRYAVLDDAILEDVDFTNADLTGLRLEETADVEAVVGQEGDLVFAAYADGLLRRWQMMPQRVSTDTISEGVRQPVDSIAGLPNGDIALACKDTMLVYRPSTGDNEMWTKYTQFRLRPDIRIRSLREDSATAHVELGSATEILVALTESGRIVQRRTVIKQVTCSEAHPEVLVAYGTDDGVRIEWWVEGILRSSWGIARRGVTALTVSNSIKNSILLVVTGYRDGVLEMSRIDLQRALVETVWEIRPHHDVVSCIDLTSRHVISGSADRSINVIDLETAAVYRCLQRTVRCHGMRIEGVQGPSEREMLRDLIVRSGQRH